jgi:hypothetical protein
MKGRGAIRNTLSLAAVALLMSACGQRGADTFGKGYDECILKNLATRDLNAQMSNRSSVTEMCRDHFLVEGNVPIEVAYVGMLDDILDEEVRNLWNRKDNRGEKLDIWVSVDQAVRQRSGVDMAVIAFLDGKRLNLSPLDDSSFDSIFSYNSRNVTFYKLKGVTGKLPYAIRVRVIEDVTIKGRAAPIWSNILRKTHPDSHAVPSDVVHLPNYLRDGVTIVMIMPEIVPNVPVRHITANAEQYLKN